MLLSVPKLAGDLDLLPQEVLFDGYEWYLLGVGMILLAPGVIFSFTKYKR